MNEQNPFSWDFEDSVGNIITIASQTLTKDDISLESTGDLQYTLLVDGEVKGTINIPKDQFLKSVEYDSATQTLTFVFITESGEETVEVPFTNAATKEYVDELISNVNKALSSLNDNLVSAINTINESIATVNQNLVDSVNTINSGIDNEIRPSITSNTEAIKTNAAAITKNAEDIATLNSKATELNNNLVSSINTINESVATVNQNLVDSVNTINGGIDNEIRPAIESNTEAIETEVTRATAAEENLLAQFDLISLEGEGLEYKLTVGDRLAGTITIPEDQFLKSVSYDAATTTLTLVFTTSEGEQTVNVDLSGLVDTYVAGNGLVLDGNSFSVNIASDNEGYLTVSENGLSITGIDAIKTSLEGEISGRKLSDELHEGAIDTINNNLTSEISNRETADTTLQTNIDTEVQARTAADTELQTSLTTETANRTTADEALQTSIDTINETLTTKADKTEIPSLDGYATQTWVSEQGYLTEHQDISGLATKDEVTAVQSNVDAEVTRATAAEQTNADAITAETERATAAEEANATAIETESTARVKGDEANAANVTSLDALITAFSDKFSLIENRLNNIVKSSSTSVENYDGTETLSDDTASYYIDAADITNTATITSSSVTLADSTLSNDARLKITSNDVEVSNLTVSGEFPKSTSNAIVSVNNANTVSFKDTTFDLSDSYNAIEIGLSTSSSTLPKNILFDNCSFVNSVGNNAILIFGTQDNATITLNNCSFEKVSNVLRLSNRTNATGVTVNVVNCTVGQWETTAPWQGFLCLQDYTSTSNEEVISNNLFAPEKIAINFINLTYQGVKYAPADVTTLLGTKADDQFGFIYANKYSDDTDGFRAYAADIYPTITFK